MLSKENLLEIVNISVDAGEVILNYYNENVDVIYKDDESPLTKADLASHKIITDSIKKITPDIPILSEEEFIDWKIRKKWKKYWLIDPLDGTKEFIKKNDEFTVNIALIENNRPILGVIYTPALNELFYSIKNFGSYKILTKKKLNTLKEAKRISINKKKSNKIKIVGSRSHSNPILDKWVNKNVNEFDILQKRKLFKVLFNC
jgi:3''-Phosphoadenosine 5''-phosphosulfate (PAPS) 3''-phosphatase